MCGACGHWRTYSHHTALVAELWCRCRSDRAALTHTQSDVVESGACICGWVVVVLTLTHVPHQRRWSRVWRKNVCHCSQVVVNETEMVAGRRDSFGERVRRKDDVVAAYQYERESGCHKWRWCRSFCYDCWKFQNHAIYNEFAPATVGEIICKCPARIHGYTCLVIQNKNDMRLARPTIKFYCNARDWQLWATASQSSTIQCIHS